MNKKTSRIPGFYKLTPDERIRKVAEFTILTKEEIDYLKNTGTLRIDQADKMSENIIGTMQLPLGIAVNFMINSRDYLVPMAIEEPSVIAAASNAARIARHSGGFQVQSMESIMIGQKLIALFQTLQVKSLNIHSYLLMEIHLSFEKQAVVSNITGEGVFKDIG